jgi:hypothetical protein
MEPFLFDTGQPAPQRSAFQMLRGRLRDEFFLRKLDTPLGYSLLALAALLPAYLIGLRGERSGWFALTALTLTPVLLISLFNLRYGLYLLWACACALPSLRLLSYRIPTEAFIHGSIFLLLFGLFLRQVQRRDWSFLNHSLSLIPLAWMLYLLLELFNPWAISQRAWLYAVGDAGVVYLAFFPAMYVLQGFPQIRRSLYVWIAVLALTGFVGLLDTGGDSSNLLDWVDWERDLRSGQVLWAGAALAAAVIGLGPVHRPRDRYLAGGLLAVLAAVLLSEGARLPLALMGGGLALLAMLRLRLRWLGAGVAVAALALWLAHVMNAPFSPSRLLSSLDPFSSPNFVEVQQNEAYIQPFIQRNPIGGGLGSTGKWGEQFASGSYLSQFKPGSGYVRLAAETGWVGLLLYVLWITSVMAAGIRAYFRAPSPEQRTWAAALLCFFFVMVLGNYATPVLLSLPGNLLFALLGAALARLGGALAAD